MRQQEQVGRNIGVLIAMLFVMLVSFSTGYYFGKHSVRQVVQSVPIAKLQAPVPVAEQKAPPAPVVRNRVVQGDTFSELVEDLYGDGSRKSYEAAARVVQGLDDPDDPDTLWVGQVLSFPCTIIVGGETLHASLKQAERRWTMRHADNNDDSAAFMMNNSAPVLPEAKVFSDIQAPDIASSSAPGPLFLFAWNIDPPLPPEEPMPKKRKVTGYRMTIPGDAAADIPLERDLETCIIFHDAEDRECGLVSRAELKSGNVVLSTSLKEIPSRPFELMVAGIGPPIDKEDISLHATPFHGRFPGKPRMIIRILLGTGRIAGNGLLMTAMTGNPWIGFGVAVGHPAVRFMFKHHHHQKGAYR